MAILTGTKIEKRLITNGNGLWNDVHEVVFDNPREGLVYDRCHMRFTTLENFYRIKNNKYWIDIAELAKTGKPTAGSQTCLGGCALPTRRSPSPSPRPAWRWAAR